MDQKQIIKQLVDKLQRVNSVLITVSKNPSIDELTSALALTMIINKLDKRAVAVFSGQIPGSINFLEPEKTFDNTADSLRDFIISLSKDKAKRLRVNPDGDFVKVYITPYRKKITSDDITFEDGNFNVELIIAIGATNRADLDQAIASHGKIFHDAITATINLGSDQDRLGSISWQGQGETCYSEMIAQLAKSLNAHINTLIDAGTATALLTGVISATDRFRNSATTAAVMALASELMQLGANQRLIAAQFDHYDDPTLVDDNLATASVYDRKNEFTEVKDDEKNDHDASMQLEDNDTITVDDQYDGSTLAGVAPVAPEETINPAIDQSSRIDQLLELKRREVNNNQVNQALAEANSQLASSQPVAVLEPEPLPKPRPDELPVAPATPKPQPQSEATPAPTQPMPQPEVMPAPTQPQPQPEVMPAPTQPLPSANAFVQPANLVQPLNSTQHQAKFIDRPVPAFSASMPLPPMPPESVELGNPAAVAPSQVSANQEANLNDTEPVVHAASVTPPATDPSQFVIPS